jgi:amidase
MYIGRWMAIVFGVCALCPSAKAQTAEFQIMEATVAKIHAAMTAGRLTCVQLTQGYLDRIDAYNKRGPVLNTIRTLNPKALDDAKALDAALKSSGFVGPLHCIPILLKDNIDTADMPTSNDSPVLRSSIPKKDAFIVTKLLRQGALILGKATMGEFAMNNYSSLDGVVRNPYNVQRSPSGSSAGPAAAVAASLTALSVGTDTSSSIRDPAAVTGIVGIRPTTGLVSRAGIIPKNMLFDTAGPLARTVSDAAILLSTMTGKDSADDLNVKTYANYPMAAGKAFPDPDNGIDYGPYLRPGALKGARLGIVRNFFVGDPEIVALATKAIAVMKTLGADIVDITLDPAFVEFNVTNGRNNIRRIADYRFRSDFETYLKGLNSQIPKTLAEFNNLYETKIKKTALPPEDSLMDLFHRALTTTTDSPEYLDLVSGALPAATEFKRAVFSTNNIDALVFPSRWAFATPIDTPTLKIRDQGYVPSGAQGTSADIFGAYSSVGNPEIVVPMGFGSQGLPMTISILGKPYDEGLIIGYAYDYEQATKLRAPPNLP